MCRSSAAAALRPLRPRQIVALILSIAETVNNDPEVGDLLKVRRLRRARRVLAAWEARCRGAGNCMAGGHH